MSSRLNDDAIDDIRYDIDDYDDCYAVCWWWIDPKEKIV